MRRNSGVTKAGASGLLTAMILGSMFAASTPARASSSGTDAMNFVSGTGTALYLAAGVGLPLLQNGAAGKQQALRAADSLLASGLLAEGLERVTGEQRPDGSDNHSFPSTHAAASFAIAAMESSFHPRQAPIWYTGAALISASRVGLHKHYIHDVLAGALLGYGMSRWELSRKRGLILFPWINSSPTQSMGLRLGGRF